MKKNIKIYLFLFVISLALLFLWGYSKSVFIPKAKLSYFQLASVVSLDKNLGSKFLPPPPCNPQVTQCGVIRVTKNTSPDNYQDFTFNHNITGYPTPFILDDDASLSNPSTLSNVGYFYTPYNGLFTISETLSPNFSTSISCTNNQTNATQSVTGSSISINIINGSTISCVFTNYATQSNPTSSSCLIPNSWTQKLDFPTSSRVNAVAFSIGGKGYVGTGYVNSFSIATSYSNDFWEYNPLNNTWTQKANFGGVGREMATGFSIGGKGYIGTGYRTYPSTLFNDFWEYNPVTNLWTQKANVASFGRYEAVGFSIGGKGYMGTGQSAATTTLNDFWEYDPLNNSWIQKANVGGGGRVRAAGLSSGSKGYIGLGSDSLGYINSSYNDFWEYNPVTNLWIQKANFGGGVRVDSISFPVNNKLYISTGYGGFLPGFKDLWEYNPTYNSWNQRSDYFESIQRGFGFSIGGKGYVGGGLDINFNNNYNAEKDFWEYCPN